MMSLHVDLNEASKCVDILGICHKEWNRRGRKGFQNLPLNYAAQCKKQELFT